ncbi:hypothetical protein BSKO_12302 [Bryopsis sp. KO-2023]|nr:hypothetical protein BSKO_12302 [Bryopsis sp. KO-2023]
MAVATGEVEKSVVEGGRKNLRPKFFNDESIVTLKLLAAGGIAGATAKSITAPLARLTIMYQVQGFGAGQAPPLLAALSQVVRQEGVRALWKGNMATVLHRLPYSAVSFLTYEKSTAFLQKYFPKDKNVTTGSGDLTRRFISGGLAGMVGTAVAYPLDLVRTRLAVQTTSMYYQGIRNSLQTIIADEGIRGLYKGLGGSLLQVGPNLAINYCAYETLRSYWMTQHPDRNSPGLFGSLLCGGLSGFVSSSATFPIDLVRRRMQLQGQRGLARQYTGYAHAAREILRTSGWRGFYTGIVPEYCKVMPGVAIVYATFELVKRIMKVDHINAGKR